MLIWLKQRRYLYPHRVPKAAERIRNAVSKAIAAKAVTEDLAAQVPGSRTVGCVEFGDIIGANL